MSLNGTLSVSGQRTPLKIVACNPLHATIVIGASNAAKYVVRAGLKSYTQAEIGLIKSFNNATSPSWRQLTNELSAPVDEALAVASMQLVDMQGLRMRLASSRSPSSEWEHTKQFVEEQWKKMKADMNSALNKFILDVKDSDAHLTVDFFKNIAKKIKSHADAAVEKVETWYKTKKSQYKYILDEIKDLYRGMKEQYQSLIKYLSEVSSRKMSPYIEEVVSRAKAAGSWMKQTVLDSATYKYLKNYLSYLPVTWEKAKKDAAKAYGLLEREPSYQRIKATLRSTVKL